jgi:hypothetical protein
VLIDALKERGGIAVIKDDGPESKPNPIVTRVKVKHRTEEHADLRIEARARAA